MHMKLDLHFPVPTERLPKTTPAELAGQLEGTIQTISEKDTGIVITRGDKPNLILCPAAWFNFCFDDDFGCIINSAVAKLGVTVMEATTNKAINRPKES